jgi:hypothetical protein
MSFWVGSMIPLSAPASIAIIRKASLISLRLGSPKLTLLIPVAFLDINVDEYSHKLPEQLETMRYLVGRVENASRMIDAALGKGIPPHLIYVDPLMFPISVDGDFGHHVLDAIRAIRTTYGSEIHITGRNGTIFRPRRGRPG